jgi:hypothetical protein
MTQSFRIRISARFERGLRVNSRKMIQCPARPFAMAAKHSS